MLMMMYGIAARFVWRCRWIHKLLIQACVRMRQASLRGSYSMLGVVELVGGHYLHGILQKDRVIVVGTLTEMFKVESWMSSCVPPPGFVKRWQLSV